MLDLHIGTTILEGETETVLVLRDVAVAAVGKPSNSAKRSPLALALVIDASASMHGAPLKAAIASSIALIDSLSDEDEALVVTFSDDAVLECDRIETDSLGKKALHVALSTLKAYGRTDLESGLRLGARALRNSTKQRVILLLSDGVPNRGETDPQRLALAVHAAKASVSTMGFGTDYDPSLLAGLASHGCGTHDTIPDTSLMAYSFTRALSHVSDTVYDNVLLERVRENGAVDAMRLGSWVRNESRAILLGSAAFTSAQVRAHELGTAAEIVCQSAALSPARANLEARVLRARSLKREATRSLVQGDRDAARRAIERALRVLGDADPFLGAELLDHAAILSSRVNTRQRARSLERVSLAMLPEEDDDRPSLRAWLVRIESAGRPESDRVELGILTRAGHQKRIASELRVHRHSYIVFAHGSYRLVPEYGIPKLNDAEVEDASVALTHGATVSFESAHYRFEVS
jgi:uncharacterized protein YegL